MENVIVCTLIYVAIIAIAYQPKPDSIDYFPEIEETEPIEVVEEYPAAAPAFKVEPSPIMAMESDLMGLSIRQLKVLAKGRVKNYSSLTKSQLSKRLAGMIPLTDL